jgi:hypothetical protein
MKPPPGTPYIKGLGVRQRTILRLMNQRGGYPGSDDSPWPYLSHPEVMLILEGLFERGLIRRAGEDRYEITDKCRELARF